MSALSESVWDAIILGAGISGLVSASLLHRQGLRRILIIDEYDRIGGNQINCDIGSYTFDVGAMLFDNTSPLLHHFPELLPLYHPVSLVSGRITPDGKLREYPFSIRDEVVSAGPIEWVRLLASVAWARLPPCRITNAEEYACYWLGRHTYQRCGLGNYIERFHGAKPSDIDKPFAEKRMSELADSASIRKRLGRMLFAEKLSVPIQNFVRPRGGFSKLYGAAAARLRSNGTSFALGKNLHAVVRDGPLLRMKADGYDAASPRVIATIPLTRTCQLCGFPDPALPTATLVSLFVSFKGRRGFPSNVLFNFSRRGQWKRITMFSDFYGPVHDREYFTVEINCVPEEKSPHAAIGTGALFDDFRTDIEEKGLFDGVLTLEGSHLLENGYPVYRKGVTEAAAAVIRRLQEFGIESLGRQGGFDYLPTVVQVTLAVEHHFASPALEGGG